MARIQPISSGQVTGSDDFTVFDELSVLGRIKNPSGSLVFSSSDGVAAVSSSFNFLGTDKNYHIRAVNSHLILSSSGGSVIRMSGAMGNHKITAATLPAGSTLMSGAVVWVDDAKQFAIYGPLGWTRILTGAVVG